MESNHNYTYQQLAAFAEAVFLKMGCTDSDAARLKYYYLPI